MRWFWQKVETKAGAQELTVLQQLVAAAMGQGMAVTPDNCERSPTMRAIVTAISNRIKSTPVHVYQKTMNEDGKEIRKRVANHWLESLLQRPNEFQSRVDYWGDLASCLVRWGRFHAIKAQGQTGPIRGLYPAHPSEMELRADEDGQWRWRLNGKQIDPAKVHHIRGTARDFHNGDSTVKDIATAIGLEIACEEFGATFFNNGAVPLMVLKQVAGWKDPKDEERFVASFQEKFSGKNRHRALLLPKGIEKDGELPVENDKAQFLETRKFSQTVIAGAYNVPPHLVGNLENAHYNNIENQDGEFTMNVIMPWIVTIEAAMERDLLNDNDRRQGLVVRFNMDSTLRADYLTRMQGYEIQIRNAMLTPNEAREHEGKNPLPDDASDSVYYSTNLVRDGEEPEPAQEPPPADNDSDEGQDDE